MERSYHESELDHVAGVFLGGPIDGARYRVPVFPDGRIPETVSTPLRQPHATSPRAHYLREGDEPVGGYYVFFYDRTTGPDGEPYLHETPERTNDIHPAKATGDQR